MRMGAQQQVAEAPGLSRRKLGTGSLIFFTVSASAPLTVLGGGVVATLAVTGNIGTPLSFPVLGIALALWAVGYAAMTRYLDHGGAFATYLAQGLGRTWGVAGTAVAMLAYNTIQIGLYGLFGAVAAGFAEAQLNITWPWYAWAAIAWAVVGILGMLGVDLSAKVLGVFLICELIAVIAFDFGAFTHPAPGGGGSAGLSPGELFGPGLGGVFALGIAAFVGFESAAVYSSEAKDPRRTVARATYIAVAITSVLYCVSALALIVGAGADKVVAQAQDPAAGLPFSLIEAYFGHTFALFANLLLITSVFAALLSFHQVVARYTWSAGKEGVLPRFAATTSRRTSAPIAGSLMQSLLAAVVVGVFVAVHTDPITQLFTWLSYVSALGVLLLMLGTSLAVVGFFRTRSDAAENTWQRTIAPILAAVALAAILTVTAAESDSVLGAQSGSLLTYVLPGLVAVTAVLGLVWGVVLRSARPDVYAGIGHGGAQSTPVQSALAGLIDEQREQRLPTT